MDGTFLFIFDGVCICNPHGGTLLVVSSKFKDFTHQGSRSGWGMQTQEPADRRSGHCVATVTLLTDRSTADTLIGWLIAVWFLQGSEFVSGDRLSWPKFFTIYLNFSTSNSMLQWYSKKISRLLPFATHRNYCHSSPISRYTRIKTSIQKSSLNNPTKTNGLLSVEQSYFLFRNSYILLSSSGLR